MPTCPPPTSMDAFLVEGIQLDLCPAMKPANLSWPLRSLMRINAPIMVPNLNREEGHIGWLFDMDSLTFSLRNKKSGWFNVCSKTCQKQELSGFEVMCILLLWWRGKCKVVLVWDLQDAKSKWWMKGQMLEHSYFLYNLCYGIPWGFPSPFQFPSSQGKIRTTRFMTQLQLPPAEARRSQIEEWLRSLLWFIACQGLTKHYKLGYSDRAECLSRLYWKAQFPQLIPLRGFSLATFSDWKGCFLWWKKGVCGCFEVVGELFHSQQHHNHHDHDTDHDDHHHHNHQYLKIQIQCNTATRKMRIWQKST